MLSAQLAPIASSPSPPPYVANLSKAARRDVREAILELLCRPLPGPLDTRRAPVDKRRGTAGLGSSLNVFLTQALQLMRKGAGVDTSKYVIRDSEHGAIFNRTRCPAHTLGCLFRGFAHPCSAPGAPLTSQFTAAGAATPERAAAAARIRSAHPYAVANELARLAFRPNAWLAPQVRAMEEAVGGRADIAVHVRRGDKFLQELGVACPTCTKSKTATRREHIMQPRNGRHPRRDSNPRTSCLLPALLALAECTL